MSQPAVTFQIRQLEERYQVRLFERGHGQISLTPAGKMVLEFAERIIGLSDEMEMRLAEVTDEMRGHLEIGASNVIAETVMPGILADFNALYPQARSRLVVANSASIESRVAAHALDIGFINGEPADVAGLEVNFGGEDELLVVCAPDCPLAKESVLTVAQLHDYECLTREPGSGMRRTIEAYFQKNGMPTGELKIQMELGSLESLKRLVATGLGYAIIPARCIEREKTSGEVVGIPLQPRLLAKIAVILPKDRFRSRLVSTFAEFAHRKLEGIPS